MLCQARWVIALPAVCMQLATCTTLISITLFKRTPPSWPLIWSLQPQNLALHSPYFFSYLTDTGNVLVQLVSLTYAGGQVRKERKWNVVLLNTLSSKSNCRLLMYPVCVFSGGDDLVRSHWMVFGWFQDKPDFHLLLLVKYVNVLHSRSRYALHGCATGNTDAVLC